MKNVWIIHHSQLGNSEKLSNEVASGLKGKFNVKVGSIKIIKPEEIANDNPFALIICARIQGFNTDRIMTSFIKNLSTSFKEPNSKIATLYTHGLKWINIFSRGMRKALKKSTCIGEVCPEFLEVKIPLEGKEEKIQGYIKKLIDFLEA